MQRADAQAANVPGPTLSSTKPRRDIGEIIARARGDIEQLRAHLAEAQNRVIEYEPALANANEASG